MADQYPPDIDRLRAIGYEFYAVPAGSVLWRVHSTSGAHVLPWNRIRTWGPVATSRWDPHPLPPGDCSPLGAAYLGEDVLTCLAEVFQTTRFVDVDRNAPYVTAFRTTREVKLADLRGLWLTRAGAAVQIAFQQKERTRAWARSIHEAWPDLDGLIASSAVAGGRPVFTLWADDPMPAAPELSVPLNSPAIVDDIVAAVEEIGYRANVVL
ncbi:RES family NAD+ phosphorylase [Arthrobacter sp. KFRI-F3372]|nr:RES family NAD+ phosphorylase [Arthrobacter sp. KFRI-F3372]